MEKNSGKKKLSLKERMALKKKNKKVKEFKPKNQASSSSQPKNEIIDESTLTEEQMEKLEFQREF